MLRSFRVKLKDYIQEPITIENIQFPWKINGMEELQEGQLNGFVDWRRVVTEEKLDAMMNTIFKRINEKSILKLESIVEHSLMAKMYKEIQRFQNHNYNLIYDIQCSNYKVYNILNIYRVGIHKGRQRNRPLDMKQFKSIIDGKEFINFHKKDLGLDEMATLSIMIDIGFTSIGSVRILNNNNQCLIENNPIKEEFHQIRLESDILTANYRSAKNHNPRIGGMKRIQDNLHIVDIDSFMNGNISSNSFRYQNNMSTMIDSINDTNRIINYSSICDDSIALALFVQNAYDHIRVIRDIVAISRQQLRSIRQNVYELKNSISTLEHQQRKNLSNLEYDLQSQIANLKRKYQQNILEQEGENTLLQQQLSRLELDDQDLYCQIGQLEMKLQFDCKDVGQYLYSERITEFQ